MPPTLEDALILAAEKHRGQLDKAGNPYILHPLRVMNHLGHGASGEERMAAVLHDVVEDSDVTLADLRARGFPEAVVAAVDALTKRPEEEQNYFAAIRRAGANPIAKRVKIADLTDNLDLSRIARPSEKDHARIARYEQALRMLRD